LYLPRPAKPKQPAELISDSRKALTKSAAHADCSRAYQTARGIGEICSIKQIENLNAKL
jgi:hypothetical protein